MNELSQDTMNRRYFSRSAYNRFFDRYFTQMQYSRDNFTDGNAAALKIDDKASSLNLTLSQKTNNLILNLGTVVNVSDNSGIIFSGDKPTAGTELFTSFSYLLSKQRMLNYRGDRQRANWRKRQWLLDSLTLTYTYKIPNLARKLQRDSINLESRLQNLDQRIRFSSPDEIPALKDSVIDASDKLYKTKEELKKLDNGTDDVEDIIESIIQTADKLSIQKQLETPGVTTFRMVWLSAGVRYRRDVYSTYDSTLTFSSRIDDFPFDRWTFQGSFNFLWQKTDEWLKFMERSIFSSFYFNISYGIVRENSYAQLKESTLSLNRSRSSNDSTYEFSKSYKVRDISNRTFSEQWIHRPSLTLTPMFGTKHFIGLNLIMSGQFQKSTKSIFNLRSGLLFQFKNVESEKSVVNFELFLSFLDLTDTQNTNKSVWKNKQVGVAANVPFEKVFFR